MKKEQETVEKLIKELLSLMGSKAQVEVSVDEENKTILVNLKTDDEAGLLIGRRGEVILSIQTILGMVVKNALGEWIRISVNVGDWKEKEESHLKELAIQASDRAKETGEPQYLYNLTANQRRIVHLTLSNETGIKTESQGEGKERFLVVSKKD